MDEVGVQPSYYSLRPLYLKVLLVKEAVAMISPYYCGPTSSMLLHDASACNSSTPCYFLVPLDILLCQYWVTSNLPTVDRTVICNVGV